MALHNELGTRGEALGMKWLEANGYTIMHKNWRYSYYEIDAIAMKEHTLCFIEIKTRNYSKFGYPEDSVTRRKFKQLQRAADQYLFLHPGHKWIRYDVLSITMHRNGEVEYFLLEDVFLY